MSTNLKEVLMNLGNRLVTERGYAPGMFNEPKSTKPIVDFTKFLNEHPDAIELLEEMGFEWPVVKKCQ